MSNGINKGLIRVHDDDPNRCTAVTSFGQCHMLSVVNEDKHTRRCKMHHGNLYALRSSRKSYKDFLIETAKLDYNNFEDNKAILQLREEIILTRTMLANKLRQCQDDVSLSMQSTNISILISQLSDLVPKCHKLEQSLGKYLDKTDLANFCSDLVALISSKVQDSDLMNDIGQGILEVASMYINKEVEEHTNAA